MESVHKQEMKMERVKTWSKIICLMLEK
nr:hypothetical protein Iba_scaffold45323CG0010 [Ipomoea batatas]GMD53441.1 hypothetical protein Iba_chr11cCG2680 [Ipomoea batatas]